MKRALISDIHSNLEALSAVLEDIRAQQITEIYCLGDVIGYGANPRECLDKVRQETTVCLLGNHDQAALFDPEGFNPVALQAIYWTRGQLDTGPGGANAGNIRWDYLGELARVHIERDYTFVHGSPREPTNEYVFPEDVYNRRKMQNLFGRFERYCFQGHTHIPGVFTESLEFLAPDEFDFEYELPEAKAMFNIGSVGQPRDGDPRASYAVLTDDRVVFRRIEYPIETAAEKILAVADLDNMLANRLFEGR